MAQFEISRADMRASTSFSTGGDSGPRNQGNAGLSNEPSDAIPFVGALPNVRDSAHADTASGASRFKPISSAATSTRTQQQHSSVARSNHPHTTNLEPIQVPLQRHTDTHRHAQTHSEVSNLVPTCTCCVCMHACMHAHLENTGSCSGPPPPAHLRHLGPMVVPGYRAPGLTRASKRTRSDTVAVHTVGYRRQ